MDTLFENKCIYSKENLLEMVRKKRQKPFIVCSYTLIAYLGVNAVSHFFQQDFIKAVILLFSCVAFTCLYLFSPYISVKKMLKRDNELYHTECSATILFFDDHFVGIHEPTSGQTITNYTHLIQVSQTKGLYLLSMRENLVWMVDKNGFIKGDRMAFETFIKEKAVHAKIKL